MSLVEHLSDLRRRLILSLLGIAVGMALGIWQSELLLELIRKPIQPYLQSGGLVFTGVMDKFLAHLKVGALGGLILACPWWLYQLWQFISPGLYKNERKYAVGFIVSGTILFMMGVGFVYFFVYPAAFEYLLNVGGNVDKPMITISEYLGFFITTTVMFGLSFELPLVLVFLALVGVIDAPFLKRNRRFAIPGMSLVAAIITPPDAISMLMMLVPMVGLYEISILVIQYLLPKANPAGQ
ncbi:MAG: twin-arginine translocase subunit TatC [Bdellovibrionales bacterium]|nr:twin-arginine translocase subunit TatC [Bdellovibrionales bacterium]